jgi:hypothetical protein
MTFLEVKYDDLRGEYVIVLLLTSFHHLTGATKVRKLIPVEFKQLTFFMLSNSNVMDEWREFYDNATNGRERRGVFPNFHDYMKEKLLELDEMMSKGESVSHFPPVTDDVRTLVHGPQRVVTSRTAVWTEGRHFWISSLDEKRARTFDCGVQGQFTQDS